MPTLLYAPTTYTADNDSIPIKDDVKYYQWQKKLWNFLANKKDFAIIWKAFKRSNHSEDPFQFFEAENIRYSTGNFKKEVKKADMVFLDFPSTAYYDTVRVGKPVSCITIVGDMFLRCGFESMMAGSHEQALIELEHFMKDPEATPYYDLHCEEQWDWKEIVLGGQIER